MLCSFKPIFLSLILLFFASSCDRSSPGVYALELNAGDVVFIPDYHTNKAFQEYTVELQRKAWREEIFLSEEGILYRRIEERKNKQVIGMEAGLPIFFCGLLAHHANAITFHRRMESIPESLRRFYLSQFIAILIGQEAVNVWDDVVRPKVRDAGKNISPDLKEFYELVNPISAKDSFKDPRDGAVWIERNQEKLERLSETIGILINATANYIYPRMREFAEKHKLEYDPEVAHAILEGRLDAQTLDREFRKLNAELREPFIRKHILLAREEAKSKGKPLYVLIGADHVARLTKEVRSAFKNDGKTSRVVIDDALLRKVDLNKVPEMEREMLERVLLELEAVK